VTASGIAHGRVNLLGEHTDYNDGYVLPTAIPQATRVDATLATDDLFLVEAHDLDERATFTLEAPPAAHFATYVYGCLREMAMIANVPPLHLRIRSDVPMGVGLSSSAALEVATLRALRALLDVPLDDVALALMAQRAENRYAGVQCGVLDQMASSLGGPGSMLFLDTRTFERRVLPLPQEAELLVLHSGVSRSLAESGYNARRAECTEAARRLGVVALRDVSDVARADLLPEPLARRVRHVVTENARVLAALDAPDAAAFGALMNASHRSLADDYEVSIPPLDALVALLQADTDVHGAKLTGAGFGGACVALCRAGRARAVAARVLLEYAATGVSAGRMLVP
jgi:galactokinase